MKPRLGFLGVGWIGRNRLEAIAQSGVADIVAVCDAAAQNAMAAAQLVSTSLADSLDELLETKLDGLVIATPSALHAEQAITALERGIAVFCQKPLGRNASETSKVVEAARHADLLLAVDLSYRFVKAAQRVRQLVRSGELGSIYAIDLIFHNAYGPDKAWFYNPALSGGGCVIDLGIHLVDLALWVMEPASVSRVASHLFAHGKPLENCQSSLVEDFALAELELAGGAVVRLACSWNLPAGCDAVIEASFVGTDGGAKLSNVDGSFYDFTAHRARGTRREQLCSPPDEWGSRAITEWATRLGQGAGFDPSIERLIDVAAVLDMVYGRAPALERVARPNRFDFVLGGTS